MSTVASPPVTCTWCGRTVVSESPSQAAVLRAQPLPRRLHEHCRLTILCLCEDGIADELEDRMTERAAP